MTETALYTDLPAYFGDLCEEVRLFLPVRRIEQLDAPVPEKEGWTVIHRCRVSETADGIWAENSARLYLDGEPAAECSEGAEMPPKSHALEYKKHSKRAAKNVLFRALESCAAIGSGPMPWGSLTGVRPTKLFRENADAHGEDFARELFLREFHVSPEKTELAAEICGVQRPIIDSTGPDDVDLYMGIPFCPSKCAYCSFASSVLTKKGDAERAYVEAVLRELELIAPIFQARRLRHIYIGGGTPTALGAELISRLLTALPACAGEFTVEAGRPDSINAEALAVLRNAGVDRISVNAQTMKDATLAAIGRAHTGEDFRRAFAMAREAGFPTINTDMIVGLPGETTEDVLATVRELIALGPENITVHTLAIKRASRFAGERELDLPDSACAAQMLELCDKALREADYGPYYMYRQKYMAGNLENTGYSLPGHECRYNVDMMEETVAIAAVGAGGISKRLWPAENRIERSANVKDIAHYTARAEEMAERKLELFLERR